MEGKDIEVKMIVAGGLYEKGKLSSGQAAEIVGVSKREFIELLGKFGFNVISYPPEELQTELRNFEEWKKL